MRRVTMILFVLLLAASSLHGCGSDEQAALEHDIIWTNNNIQAVQNNPKNPTVITLEEDFFVTAIIDYHYFNDDQKPGTISLIGDDGIEYGPWKAKGRVGQGEVENAYWDTFPNVQLKAGTYEVIDSHIESWSHNDESGNSGFTEVRGYAAGNE